MDESTRKLRVVKKMGVKYYRAEDVDDMVQELNHELDDQLQELESLRPLKQSDGQLDALSSDHQKLLEDYQALSADHQKLMEDYAAIWDQLSQMEKMYQSEHESMEGQINTLQDELDQAARRTEYLNSNLERRQQEIAQLEQNSNGSDVVAQANAKAQRIISDAIAESDRILNEITSQRSRVIAATRAAYYNALQFKMSLSERFHVMDHDIDDAIDVLRLMETPPTNALATEQDAFRDGGKPTA